MVICSHIYFLKNSTLNVYISGIIKQDILWFKSLPGNVSQLEIGNLEKTRSIMAEELVKLTNQNDELEEKVKEIPKLRTQLRVSILHSYF